MKVLIVEDDNVLSLMLSRMVTEMGHQVLNVVTKGQHAIREALENKPDIILMDIMLDDDTDGIEAYRQIKEQLTIPVIYITGNSDSLNKRRANQFGYHDFLTKPIIFKDLKQSIRLINNKINQNQ